MFVKKATAHQLENALASLREAFGKVEPVEDAPTKEYMIKWLSVFAPEMSVYDAKSFCLPRKMYKNYVWHAFSFQKTDCFVEEDAAEAFKDGFAGECYVLLNDENLLCTVPDGGVFDPESVKGFENIVVFTKDFTRTYVHTGKSGFGPYYKSADMAVADGSEPCAQAEFEDINEDEEP